MTINELPDEIIVSVLLRLSIREAARTSVLSRRWRKLWTFLPSLNFNDSITLSHYHGLKRESLKFVNCVNQVLNSHQAQTICEFMIKYELCSDFCSDVNTWIQFAMDRRVQKLHLELGNSRYLLYEIRNKRTFPSSPPLQISTLDSLTDLCLSYVEVTGEILENFLYNCRNLEQLRVEEAESLVSLKVSGLPLKLKILDINFCNNLKTIDISASNLRSFRYRGYMIDMIHFKNFPGLVKASFGGSFSLHVINSFRQLSSYFARLETLALEIYLHEVYSAERLNFVVLNNVKHLELKLIGSPRSGHSILPILVSVVNAFPCLNRVQVKICGPLFGKNNIEGDASNLEPRKGSHQLLKVVELLGFGGSAEEVEIATYFIENALLMETLVFDTRNQFSWGTPPRWEEDYYKDPPAARNAKDREKARKCAQQLRGKLPLGARIVVL